jgi:hypothetical protein
MLTQNASDELRTLNAAEVETVSGAAKEFIDMGLFGKLIIGGSNGCATWTDAESNGDGVLSTKFTQCPK